MGTKEDPYRLRVAHCKYLDDTSVQKPVIDLLFGPPLQERGWAHPDDRSDGDEAYKKNSSRLVKGRDENKVIAVCFSEGAIQ